MKKLLTIMLTFFMAVNPVLALEAKTLTMEEVKNAFETKLNSLGVFKTDNDEDAEVKVELETGSKMTVKIEEENFAEFAIAEDVLTLTREITYQGEKLDIGDNPMSENVGAGVGDSDELGEAFKILAIVINDGIIYGSLVETVAELKGYTERDIRLFTDYENAKIDTNGYEVSQSDDDPGKKITLTYKVDINKLDLKVAYTDEEAPVVTVSEITKDSVTLSIELNEKKRLEIEKSLDGNNWELFQDVESQGTVGVTDTDLTPNTTYYYRVAYYKSKNYSEVKTVQTLSENSTADEVTDNPKTGIKDLLLTGSIVLGGILISSIYTYRKEKSYKI